MLMFPKHFAIIFMLNISLFKPWKLLMGIIDFIPNLVMANIYC